MLVFYIEYCALFPVRVRQVSCFSGTQDLNLTPEPTHCSAAVKAPPCMSPPGARSPGCPEVRPVAWLLGLAVPPEGCEQAPCHPGRRSPIVRMWAGREHVSQAWQVITLSWLLSNVHTRWCLPGSSESVGLGQPNPGVPGQLMCKSSPGLRFSQRKGFVLAELRPAAFTVLWGTLFLETPTHTAQACIM